MTIQRKKKNRYRSKTTPEPRTGTSPSHGNRNYYTNNCSSIQIDTGPFGP